MSDFKKPDLTAPALAVLLGFGVVPAHAEAVSDASGLKVDPPSGYQASKLAAKGQNSVVIGVKRPEDKDTGCQIGFAPAPQNAALSQDDINKTMRSKDHQTLATAAIAALYETRSVEAFEHGDVTGLAMVTDIKPREGIPPRAQEIQTLMILMETPKGRTSVVCVGEKSSFDARRPEFEALARSVTVPK